jgi:hypothetical protein
MKFAANQDFDDYTAKVHARNRIKERNIPVIQIQKAIETGEELDIGKGEYNNVYRLNLPVSLIVVTDERDKSIVTVYYDDDEGAHRGVL